MGKPRIDLGETLGILGGGLTGASAALANDGNVATGIATGAVQTQVDLAAIGLGGIAGVALAMATKMNPAAGGALGALAGYLVGSR